MFAKKKETLQPPLEVVPQTGNTDTSKSELHLQSIPAESPLVKCESATQSCANGGRRRLIRSRVAEESDADDDDEASAPVLPACEKVIPKAVPCERPDNATFDAANSEIPNVQFGDVGDTFARNDLTKAPGQVKSQVCPTVDTKAHQLSPSSDVIPSNDGEAVLQSEKASKGICEQLRADVSERAEVDKVRTVLPQATVKAAKEPEVAKPWPLARPTEGIWQITFDGCANWGQAHVSPDSSYIQQSGVRKATKFEVTGMGVEGSPFRIGAAKLIEGGPGLRVWLWPDGKKSKWTQSTNPFHSSRRKQIKGDAGSGQRLHRSARSSAATAAGKHPCDSGRISTLLNKYDKSERRLKAAKKSEALCKQAETVKNAPKPQRLKKPSGVLADSDGESSHEPQPRDVARDDRGSKSRRKLRHHSVKRRHTSESRKSAKRRGRSPVNTGPSLLDASWERWLLSTKPKSPSPVRPPRVLSPLADSDAESCPEHGTPGKRSDDDDSCEDDVAAAVSDGSDQPCRHHRSRGRVAEDNDDECEGSGTQPSQCRTPGAKRRRAAVSESDGGSSSSEGGVGFEQFAASCSGCFLKHS